MGFNIRMFWVPLWLMACLAFSSLFSPTAGSPMNVMTAPNVLRVGTEERIFIEVQDCVEQNVDVRISVKNHPTKTTEYAWTSVTLTRQNDFQAFGKIVIPADRFVNNRNVKQYVTLQAQFPGHLLEKVVLVSYQSAYIFIQTDKPIYTPGSTVRYRVFTMWPDMESPSDSSINLDIMTPGGIVVESKVVSLGSGIYSETYTLGNIVSFGNWKMMAKFHSNEAESFTAEFEVKEYVLPSFEVQLSTPPESPFFYVDSKELQITIKARYMFGKEVDGTAYAVFGVILGNEKKSFTSSLQRVPIQRGNGEVKLLREHITDVYQNINQLLGNSIYVSVSVLTQSGGEMVEAELRGIMIVESPYTIHFKKTPEYFKPGLSFDVMVEVVNPDGSPADSVPILVNPGGISAVTKSNGMARLPINTEPSLQRLEISARTNHPQVLSHRQAKATMVAFPYKSPTNSLLHLSVHSAEVKLGEQMKIDLYFTKPEIEQKDITYMILSRGQLVKHFRQRGNLKQMAFMVDITKEMLPSFRIVAFYHTNKNELVSDSVWVDVTDTCMGTLKLEMTRPTASYEPRRSFNLKITGDPGATVGLVAVDKSVYALNNRNRLTQKKIWDVVEKYDTGCKPGGGKDAMNVFYDAGLLFVNNNGVTPDRTDLICPANTRRKRASTVMEVRTSLISQYTDKLQKDCCLDGMKETPVSYSCKRRVQYIVDGPSCEQAFLHCCEEMQKQKDDMKVEVLHLARSEIDDGYTDRNDIMTRTNFPESWLWNDIRLSECPTNDPNCKTVTLTTKTYPFPDTITTWQLTGISLSRTHGVCVAKPLEAIVWKPFFVDLRLPYSAVQGEQLEIKAILHNYNDDTITVRIEFKEEDYICSAAYNKKWFQDEVQVGAQSTRSVPFIIIPMKHGSFPIEIKASVKNSYLSDGIKKMLRVVPQGVLMTESTKVTLYPARKGGRQVELINSNVSMADLVPSTPMNTLISLTGIGQMNSLLDNAISGESMGTLINEPRGCGEQNMAAMTLPVIAAIYLDKTNQWEAVGFDKRNKAIQHIKTGYGTQLKYHKPDGSFAIFSYSKSTTWLTAYVAKVFSMATSYARIDSSVICGAIKFLILHTQQPDGLFVEIGEVWDKNMIGDVGGVDSDASMTAFCLIAMRESSGICSSSISSLPNTIRKAETYLEQRLGSLTNPYAVALTSYALAMNKKLNREILFKFAAPDRSHWPVPRGIIIAREATAYALLALVKDGAIEEAKPIVRWLSQQQKENGGYGSTQATIMVYQAVAEYASNVREPPFDLNVDIAIQGRSLIDKINFNNENHYTTRTSKFDGINKDVKVTATGTGEAMFNMVSLYYAIPSKEESDCEMFDMKLELIEVNSEEGARVYKLKIEVLYKNREKNASMSILDVGLPTGYNFNKNDLDALSKRHDRIIADYEANKALSERGSLIIYLSKVSNTQYEEITFKIEQQMKVAFLQPAAVSVYEYYNKKRCVQFYRPGRISGELLTIRHNAGYLCAEENCSKQKKEKINNDERTNKACESTESSKIDFVYKVIVEDVFNNYTTDTYSMRILDTFKLGSTDVAPKNKLRLFLGYLHCREVLDLQPSKTYLIMGSSSNIRIIGTSFQYILGETTWVEYWPTKEECQTEKHRPTCIGMEFLEEQIVDFGCNMK